MGGMSVRGHQRVSLHINGVVVVLCRRESDRHLSHSAGEAGVGFIQRQRFIAVEVSVIFIPTLETWMHVQFYWYPDVSIG